MYEIMFINKKVKKNCYSIVVIVLRIDFVLMITNCSRERSFFFKHIKNSLCTSISKDRFNQLKIMNSAVDTSRKLDFHNVMQAFVKNKIKTNFRLNLTLYY